MTKEEESARREVAALLDQALSFMRVSARTDYFTGYSLSETIKQRLQQIGEAKDTADQYTADEQKKTLLGRLKVFEETSLSAIERAKGFEDSPEENEVG
jgi:hypothetical protein